jgi:hypothetical protein
MKNQIWKVARRTVIGIVSLAACSIVVGVPMWGYECFGSAQIWSEGCDVQGPSCVSGYSDGGCAYSVYSQAVSQCFAVNNYLDSCDDFARELNPPATFATWNGTCGWEPIGENSECLCTAYGDPVLGGWVDYSCQ